MYPASALLDSHQHPSYSTDDFHMGVEGEDIALTSAPNGQFGSSPHLALSPPGPPLARHSFLGRDPNAGAGGGGYSGYGDGIVRPNSAQSEAEWKRRAGPLARGATRKVKLTRQGHFIAVSNIVIITSVHVPILTLLQEYPVPDAIKNSQERRWLEMSKQAGRTEFTHVRYSASTVDPNDFTPENGWSLRPTLYGRQTELLVRPPLFLARRSLLTVDVSRSPAPPTMRTRTSSLVLYTPSCPTCAILFARIQSFGPEGLGPRRKEEGKGGRRLSLR